MKRGSQKVLDAWSPYVSILQLSSNQIFSIQFHYPGTVWSNFDIEEFEDIEIIRDVEFLKNLRRIFNTDSE